MGSKPPCRDHSQLKATALKAIQWSHADLAVVPTWGSTEHDGTPARASTNKFELTKNVVDDDSDNDYDDDYD